MATVTTAGWLSNWGVRPPACASQANASETTAERKTYALPRCRAAAAVALPGGDIALHQYLLHTTAGILARESMC